MHFEELSLCCFVQVRKSNLLGASMGIKLSTSSRRRFKTRVVDCEIMSWLKNQLSSFCFYHLRE